MRPAGPARAAHDDLLHYSLADFLRDAPLELRQEQAQLGGPSGGIRPDDEHRVVKGLYLAPLGELGADDLLPAADDPADAHRGAPPTFRHEAVEHRPHELGVSRGGAGPAAGMTEPRAGAKRATTGPPARCAAAQPPGRGRRLGPAHRGEGGIYLTGLPGRLARPVRPAHSSSPPPGSPASPHPGRTVPSATIIRRPSRAWGTSAPTAAVMSSCSASATSPTRRSRRRTSSSANTSSRMRIGSPWSCQWASSLRSTS